MFKNINRQTLIKTIIGIKVILIAGVWISLDKFSVGDHSIFAESSTDATKSDKTNASKDAAKDPSKKESADAASENSEPKADKRKSFLDNLLNLPSLDSDSIKREEVGRYLGLADRKRRQIDDRIANLSRREEQLQRLEKSIDEKLVKLDEERKFFVQGIQQEKDLKGQRLDKIIELYDKMDPKKAASVFEQMDKDLVVALFKRLKQKQVTLVLEMMKPDKSVQLTEYFGRVRSGREYELLREMNTSLRREFQDCRGMPAEAEPEAKESSNKAPNSATQKAQASQSASPTPSSSASAPAANTAQNSPAAPAPASSASPAVEAAAASSQPAEPPVAATAETPADPATKPSEAPTNEQPADGVGPKTAAAPDDKSKS